MEVEGATGNINTNFHNKGKAAFEELKNGKDYVFIHVEAADECGHRGEAENKIKSIEYIDDQIIGFLAKNLEEAGEDYTMLIMPDHPTPISTKTHARDPVPFMIYRSNSPTQGRDKFDEEEAKLTKIYFNNGIELYKEFLK